MRYFLVAVLFLKLVTSLLGQSASDPSPRSTKDFGHSLERYKIDGLKKHRSLPNGDASTDDVIKVRTDLIVNNFLVTDKSGSKISNLERGDFLVLEDGEPQTIELFSIGEGSYVPCSIVLVIDSSALQAFYLNKSFNAAKLFIDKLERGDRMAIVSADTKLRTDFTNNKSLLKKSLDLLETKGAEFGSGAEFSTLLAVLNELFTGNDIKNRMPIVIVQGDGNEMLWLKPDSEIPYPVSKSLRQDNGMRFTGRKSLRDFGFGEIKIAIENSRATIYSIIPGYDFIGLSKKERSAHALSIFDNTARTLGFQERNLPLLRRQFAERDAEVRTAGQSALVKVADLSGGLTRFLEKPEDADRVYADIFSNIKDRYSIGYYPTDQRQTGKRRQIRIEVKGHPEYTITGRKSYIY